MKEKESKKEVTRSVVFVRTENNLRTTLKIMRMKLKKNYLQYLKQYSTMRKEVGELSKTSFPKSYVAIQKWFPSNQNM